MFLDSCRLRAWKRPHPDGLEFANSSGKGQINVPGNYFLRSVLAGPIGVDNGV